MLDCPHMLDAGQAAETASALQHLLNGYETLLTQLLARLLSRQVAGIFLSDYEQGEIGRDLFRAACRMGLEGIVSKHRGRVYRSGRCKHWVKVKNRAHPAYSRVADLHWAARR